MTTATETQADAGRLDLVLTSVIDAPRALAWKAWTDPDHLKKWWAPAPWTTPECKWMSAQAVCSGR
jgi:uncharacterized protein YndB with AHSA1/START domain